FHTGGVQNELIRRAPIVIRVNHKLELLALRAHVATAEQRDDRVRGRIVHTAEDVEVAIVVENAQFGAKARLCARRRLVLKELIDDGGFLPRRVVRTSINDRWPRGASGTSGERGALRAEGNANENRERGQ